MAKANETASGLTQDKELAQQENKLVKKQNANLLKALRGQRKVQLQLKEEKMTREQGEKIPETKMSNKDLGSKKKDLTARWCAENTLFFETNWYLSARKKLIASEKARLPLEEKFSLLVAAIGCCDLALAKDLYHAHTYYLLALIYNQLVENTYIKNQQSGIDKDSDIFDMLSAIKINFEKFLAFSPRLKDHSEEQNDRLAIAKQGIEKVDSICGTKYLQAKEIFKQKSPESLKQALKNCSESIAIKPFGDTHYLRGQIYQELAEVEHSTEYVSLAIEDFKKCRELYATLKTSKKLRENDQDAQNRIDLLISTQQFRFLRFDEL